MFRNRPCSRWGTCEWAARSCQDFDEYKMLWNGHERHVSTARSEKQPYAWMRDEHSIVELQKKQKNSSSSKLQATWVILQTVFLCGMAALFCVPKDDRARLTKNTSSAIGFLYRWMHWKWVFSHVVYFRLISFFFLYVYLVFCRCYNMPPCGLSSRCFLIFFYCIQLSITGRLFFGGFFIQLSFFVLDCLPPAGCNPFSLIY